MELFKFNIKQRQTVHKGSMVHKVIKTAKPNYLFEFIKLHVIKVRGKDSISIPKHNIEFFKPSFPYQAASLYNKIPEHIKT